MNRLIAGAAFLGAILAANIVTSRYGLIPVGFGLTTTAGTYLAGATFVLRDLVDDVAGRRTVLALIGAGGLLSLVLADPHIAAASVVAFVLSELADLAVYAPLRTRGYVRAAVASNVVGSLVDSILFLAIAGFPIAPALPGQLLGKLTVTAATVVLVLAGRRVLLRQPHRV